MNSIKKKNENVREDVMVRLLKTIEQQKWILCFKMTVVLSWLTGQLTITWWLVFLWSFFFFLNQEKKDWNRTNANLNLIGQKMQIVGVNPLLKPQNDKKWQTKVLQFVGCLEGSVCVFMYWYLVVRISESKYWTTGMDFKF